MLIFQMVIDFIKEYSIIKTNNLFNLLAKLEKKEKLINQWMLDQVPILLSAKIWQSSSSICSYGFESNQILLWVLQN